MGGLGHLGHAPPQPGRPLHRPCPAPARGSPRRCSAREPPSAAAFRPCPAQPPRPRRSSASSGAWAALTTASPATDRPARRPSRWRRPHWPCPLPLPHPLWRWPQLRSLRRPLHRRPPPRLPRGPRRTRLCMTPRCWRPRCPPRGSLPRKGLCPQRARRAFFGGGRGQAQGEEEGSVGSGGPSQRSVAVWWQAHARHARGSARTQGTGMRRTAGSVTGSAGSVLSTQTTLL